MSFLANICIVCEREVGDQSTLCRSAERRTKESRNTTETEIEKAKASRRYC